MLPRTGQRRNAFVLPLGEDGFRRADRLHPGWSVERALAILPTSRAAQSPLDEAHSADTKQVVR